MTFLGWLSDPFKGLSDLQLGDEKGTLNHLVVNIPVPWSILEPHSTTIGDFFKPKTQTAWSPDRERSLRTEPWSTSQPPTFESSGQKPRKPKVYTFFSFYACNLEFWSLHFPKTKSPAFFFIWFFLDFQKVTRSQKKKVSQNIEVTKKWLPSPFSLDTSLTFPTTGCFVEIFPALDVSLPNFEKSMYGLEFLAIYIYHKKNQHTFCR